MNLIGTGFSGRSRTKSILAVHYPNKIDICNMTARFFCNGFIIYRPRYTSCFKNQNKSILLNDLVCSMLSVPFSLSFSPLIFTAFSWNYLIVLENLFYLLFWATLPCQAPNERATTLTRSAISNETQQIMPEKCPVK